MLEGVTVLFIQSLMLPGSLIRTQAARISLVSSFLLLGPRLLQRLVLFTLRMNLICGQHWELFVTQFTVWQRGISLIKSWMVLRGSWPSSPIPVLRRSAPGRGGTFGRITRPTGGTGFRASLAYIGFRPPSSFFNRSRSFWIKFWQFRSRCSSTSPRCSSPLKTNIVKKILQVFPVSFYFQVLLY